MIEKRKEIEKRGESGGEYNSISAVLEYF